MAKRFTDTNKWDQAWFRKLTPKMKCAWNYLCDRCDHAGVWEVDIESMTHFIGETLTLEEVVNCFKDKLIKVTEDKCFIPAFIEFQYGNLNPANKVHNSILNRIKKLAPTKDLLSPFQGPMEMEVEVDKEMEVEKEKEKERKKKVIENLFEVLNDTQLNHLLLTRADDIEKIEELLHRDSIFGDKFPTVIKNHKQKFCAIILKIYNFKIEDFTHDLTSIINEKQVDEKTGPARSDYVAARIKTKALELYNAR